MPDAVSRSESTYPVAHISRSETLYPGELLGSSTDASGRGRDHIRFLSDDNVVQLEVEGVDLLKNWVVRSR